MRKISPKACVLIGLITLLIAFVIYYLWSDRVTPSTDDAYVEAHVVQIGPRVDGRVTEVYVNTNELVKKGQLLFTLNSAQYLHALNRAKSELVQTKERVQQYESQAKAARAAIKQAQADVDYDKKQYVAYKQLKAENVVPVLKFQQLAAQYRESQQALKQAQDQLLAVMNVLQKDGGQYAQVRQAEANVNQAKQDYGDCWVRAPFEGRVSFLRVSKGMYAEEATPVIALIDTRRMWLIARVKENNLSRVKAGQRVEFSPELYPNTVFEGRVDSIGWGVNLDQQPPPVWMPYIPSTRNWVRLAQRFPVQISFNQDARYPLRVGGTVAVTIYTERDGFLVWMAEIRQRLLSWLQLFY